MYKKEYKKPEAEIVLIETSSILEGSTGATGDDVPWAAKEIDLLEEFKLEEDFTFEDKNIKSVLL